MALRIDTHTHSLCSDGTDTPGELVAKARVVGLDGIAITDHDTFDGWQEAAQAATRVGLLLIRGVEISCRVECISVHLLGYLPDREAGQLQQTFAAVHEARQERMCEMVRRVGEDYAVSYADVLEQVTEGAAIGRPHLADALVAKGYFANRSEVFGRILGRDSKYYVSWVPPTPLEMVQQVVNAGGVPVLAHPRSAGRNRRFLSEEQLAELADSGLFGLEISHREHGAQTRAELSEVAARLGLRPFGGSDYHGLGKPNLLGENTTDERVIDELAERGAIAILNRH